LEKLEQITFWRKFVNLVVLIAVLAVDVAAVGANVIVQQPLVSVVVSAAFDKAGGAHLSSAMFNIEQNINSPMFRIPVRLVSVRRL